MSCFHPLRGIVSGINLDTGNRRVIVRSWNDNYDGDEEWFPIPCGKCIGCRLDYSRQWADRMMLEYQYSPNSYFVTLTYDNDYVPKKFITDSDGVINGQALTLNKQHIVTFMKHVRKHFKASLGDYWKDKTDDLPGIRFFVAGEYGSKTLRPHYHLIIFNIKLDDLVLWQKTKQGDYLYTSDSLQHCWSNYVGIRSDGSRVYDPLGRVIIAPVTWNTCAYVARYTAKKCDQQFNDYVRKTEIQQPYVNMSRMPGIGSYYLDDHPDLFNFTNIHIATDKGSKSMCIPKYFYRQLKSYNPALYDELHTKQCSDAAQAFDILLDTLDKPYSEYLLDKEYVLKHKTKCLVRHDI